MKRIINIVLVLSFLLAFSFNVFAEPEFYITEDATVSSEEEKEYCEATLEDDFEEGELLVTFTLEATEINRVYTADELTEKFGAPITAVEDLTSIEDEGALQRINEDTFHQILALEIPGTGKQAVLDAISIIEQHEDVLSASPNYIYMLDPFDETDETLEAGEINVAEGFGIGEEEALETLALNTVYPNDTYRSKQYAIEQMQLPQAWSMTTGSTQVLVGVIDSGIDKTHPDLADNLEISLGRNFTFDGTSAWKDYMGHGTHVAGIIGAKGNNAQGITGVCWDVKIVSLKVFRKNGYGNTRYVMRAIKYAQNKNIPILNCSVVSDGVDKRLKRAINNYTGLLITAAGNDREDTDIYPYYPSGYEYKNIISVAATTEDSALEEDSNYGAVTVDLGAPGEGIYSTYPLDLCNSGTCRKSTHISTGYHSETGTSMAAPQVAGVAALIKSYYPNVTTDELKFYILSSVDELTDLSGKVVTDGRINAARALQYAQAYQQNVSNRFLSGDFNGDGRDDTACIAGFDSYQTQIRVSLSGGTSTGEWVTWFNSTGFNANKITGRAVAGDFNGDGKDDIAVMYDYSAEVANKSAIYVFISDGTSFGGWPKRWFRSTAFPALKTTNRFTAGDFNGDGKDDIAVLYDYSADVTNKSTMFVFVSTGTSFGSWPETWFTSTAFPALKTTNRFTAGDFNGDGKDDIAVLYDYSADVTNKSTMFVFVSTGTSFGSWPQTWFTSTAFPAGKTTGRFTAGDYNGDGKDDVAVLYDYNADVANKSTMYVFVSTGTSFGGWPENWFTSTSFNAGKTTGRLVTGDYNRDGKDDIVTLYDYGAQTSNLHKLIQFVSNGSAFAYNYDFS